MSPKAFYPWSTYCQIVPFSLTRCTFQTLQSMPSPLLCTSSSGCGVPSKKWHGQLAWCSAFPRLCAQGACHCFPVGMCTPSIRQNPPTFFTDPMGSKKGKIQNQVPPDKTFSGEQFCQKPLLFLPFLPSDKKFIHTPSSLFPLPGKVTTSGIMASG